VGSGLRQRKSQAADFNAEDSPRTTQNILADVEQILKLGIRMIKIHRPTSFFFSK